MNRFRGEFGSGFLSGSRFQVQKWPLAAVGGAGDSSRWRLAPVASLPSSQLVGWCIGVASAGFKQCLNA